MKTFLILLAVNIVAMILAALAFWMVVNDKPNYGWVIFAAIVCIHSPKSTTTKIV